MDLIKNIIAYVRDNATELAPSSRHTGHNGLHFIKDFDDTIGRDVYRIHNYHMFPTVMRDVADNDAILAAVAQLAHVQYDASSMWFTIDKV